MNEYNWNTLSTGLTESFQVTVTEAMVDTFTDLSGDINPLHKDRDFAQAKGFRDRVVYGMLTASFFSTLAGVYLPGKDCLLHSAEVSFRKPVYPGTVLTVSGKVQDIREHLNVFTIKVTITNQDGEKVCTGKIRAGIIQTQDKSKDADDPG